MIKEILQFLKKQKLAIKLAKSDCLFVIENLSTFSNTIKLAKLFIVKNNLSRSDKLRKFLEEENNPILFAVAQEISSCLDIISSEVFYVKKIKPIELKGDVLFKSVHCNIDKDFYVSLYKELIKEDFPKFKEACLFFEKRLDVVLDMRFYGAMFEALQDEVRDFEKCCTMEIDWIKTTKEEFYLGFDDECIFTQNLNIDAQKKLSHLFAHLLFEKFIFVSYWDGIVIGPSNNISFADIDFIYPAPLNLEDIKTTFFSNFKNIIKDEDFKLHRALELLQSYCKDIDIFKEFEGFLEKSNNRETIHSEHGNSFRSALKKNWLDITPKHDSTSINPQDISYLLDSKRHKNDPSFRKSSIYYWGPLLALIYILYKFF